MTDISRNEMEARFAASDARLDASEARTEARFVELTGKLDRLADEFRDFRSEVRSELKEVRAEVRADNKNTRWTIAVTTIAALLAGVAAIWTSQANLLAAFQAGLSRQAVVSAPATLDQPQHKASLADAR